MGRLGRLLLGIAVAALAAATLGTLALSTRQPAAPVAPDEDAPVQIYAREDDCGAPCHALATTDDFLVEAGLASIDFVVYAVLDPTSGPARVTVIDPSGDVRYDRLFSGAPSPADAAQQDVATWAAERGSWTLARSYAGTIGTLEFQAWAQSS